MKKFLLSVVALTLLCAPGGAQQNPIHAPIPKPLYALKPIEKKIYERMLEQRRELQKKYPLTVSIEATHSKGQSGPSFRRVEVTYGNYFLAEGIATSVVAPSGQSVELKSRAVWYTKANYFSLFCSGHTGSCMDLPAGVYLAKKVAVVRGDALVTALEIPILMRGGENIGGIHTEKILRLTFELLPFDPDRFRK